MSDYGIKAEGFLIKPYEICLSEILALFTQQFGKIMQDNESKFYQIARILAMRESDSWEAFKALWDQFNINAAEGSFLDDLVACFGITRLPATQSVVTLHGICDPGTYIAIGKLFQCTVNNAQFQVVQDVSSTVSEIDFDVVAIDYGPISAPIDTVTVIIENISGLDSVSNPAMASIGRYEETDDALRYRFLSYARNFIGFSTYNSIQGKLEQLLISTGKASSANIFVNDTADIDTEGRDPNSIEFVIDCPSTQDDYNAVTQVIFDVKGASVPTYLDSVVGVTGQAVDRKSFSHAINFSKISYVYAHIRVGILKSTEELFPANGNAIIKQNIIAYGESFMSKPGQDLLASPFFGEVCKVAGIKMCQIEVSLDGSGWSMNGYQNVSARQRLQYTESNITFLELTE